MCCAQSLSGVRLCDSMDCSQPGSLSIEFPRQEYWSRLPFPTPGDLPHAGIKLASLVSPALAGRFFTAEPPGKILEGQERLPVPSGKLDASAGLSTGMPHLLCLQTTSRV